MARIRSGETKRQRAQQLVIEAPAILSGIASDDRASPRHRVDAIKVLDGLAAGPATATAAEADRFIIRIDLSAGGGDVEVYDKLLTTKSKDDENSDDDVTTNDGGHGDPL